MENYTEVTLETGLKCLVKTNEDGSITSIPMDESNADYQRYLNPEAFDEASSL
jgi:hypothetical protein